MWRIEHCADRKTWAVSHVRRSRKKDQSHHEGIVPKRRPLTTGKPQAYCAKCREWTPMRWLPKNERGKRAEHWFQCEYCGGRGLTLRYLPVNEAISRNRLHRT